VKHSASAYEERYVGSFVVGDRRAVDRNSFTAMHQRVLRLDAHVQLRNSIIRRQLRVLLLLLLLALLSQAMVMMRLCTWDHVVR